MNSAYVYVHLRLESNIPFYVGKGTGKRIDDKKQRNKHWTNIVRKDGGCKKIKIVSNIDDELAYLVEIEAIDKYKKLGIKLANKTNGGEGQFGNKVNLGIAKSQSHKDKLRIVNLGKKQSKETIEKRIKSIKEKEKTGWINPFLLEKNKQKGIKNFNFSGHYLTPFGIFCRLYDAAKANNCTEKAIRVRCHGNTCKVKGKIYSYPPKDGWSFIPKV